MSVAIMGAGLSGLSCAITLEKNGVEPMIFERRSRVGDRFVNGESMFSILNRPVKDSIGYLKDNYGIDLVPVSMVKKAVFHSKNQTGSIEGEIGYTNIRGRHENSYEAQLARQVKSKINFNSKYSYDELCKEFEYVILAPGDGAYASQMGNYRCDVTSTLKGVTVEGKFTPDTVDMWFNYDVIPKGYGYILPFSEKEANIVIAYPDYPNNIKLDINSMWDRFYSLVCRELRQDFRITDSFQISKYMMGICNKPVIEKTYFVGNCFGTISPGLGFGQFASMLTGIYAALDICGLGKYEELVKPLFENYNHSLSLRRFLEELDDGKLDALIRNLDNKLFDELIDRIFGNNTSFDFLKLLLPSMKVFNLMPDGLKSSKK